MGYENVEDRYHSDEKFCDRVREDREDGRGLADCIFDDFMAFANLPGPPCTKIQISAGVAANAKQEHLLTKLIYMSQLAGVDGFPVEYRSTWTKVWGGSMCSLKKDRSHRQLLTWTGVPVEGIEKFLEELYGKNRPLAVKNLERNKKQSQAAKKRKAGEDAQRAQDTAASSSTQVEAPSIARPFLEPEPTKSSARPFLEPERPTSKAASNEAFTAP